MTKDELKKQLDLGIAMLNKGKELHEIAGMIQPDEKVGGGVTATFAKMPGLLVATNKRVIFVSKIMFDSKIEELYYNNILTVQLNSGLMSCEMDIVMPGTLFRFHDLLPKPGKVFAKYVKEQVIDAHKAPAPTQTVQLPIDPLDQLEKLAALKEKGIISADEFNAKKKQLLGL